MFISGSSQDLPLQERRQFRAPALSLCPVLVCPGYNSRAQKAGLGHVLIGSVCSSVPSMDGSALDLAGDLRPGPAPLSACFPIPVPFPALLAITLSWTPSLAPPFTHTFLQRVFIECLLYARDPAAPGTAQAWRIPRTPPPVGHSGAQRGTAGRSSGGRAWGPGAPWWQDGGRRIARSRCYPQPPRALLPGPVIQRWSSLPHCRVRVSQGMGVSSLLLPRALWVSAATYSPPARPVGLGEAPAGREASAGPTRAADEMACGHRGQDSPQPGLWTASPASGNIVSSRDPVTLRSKHFVVFLVFS